MAQAGYSDSFLPLNFATSDRPEGGYYGNHFAYRAHSFTRWCVADLAVQQRLGLLSQRRVRIDSFDHRHPPGSWQDISRFVVKLLANSFCARKHGGSNNDGDSVMRSDNRLIETGNGE